MHSTNVFASRSSPMSRLDTPDLFESCEMLQLFAHLARRALSPNTGTL